MPAVDGRTLDWVEPTPDLRDYPAVDHPVLATIAGAAAEGAPTAGLRDQVWPVPTWLDQHQEGACAGFSYTHGLAAVPNPQPVTFGQALATYLYAQYLDEWAETPPGEGTSVHAVDKAARRMGLVTTTRWLKSAAEIRQALCWVGPVVFACKWYQAMMQPNAFGLVIPTGPVVGGHAILLHGYNATGRFSWLRNSWGRGWGADGDAILRDQDLDVLIAGGYEAALCTRAVKVG